MTEDEVRYQSIEARVLPTLKDGVYSISAADWKTLTASRLAWRFTAKCYATDFKDNVEETERMVLEEAVDRMGWPEINAFKAEMAKGQSIYEDAGGYFMRGLRRLFGLPTTDHEVVTYKQAADAMVKKALSRAHG